MLVPNNKQTFTCTYDYPVLLGMHASPQLQDWTQIDIQGITKWTGWNLSYGTMFFSQEYAFKISQNQNRVIAVWNC